MDTWRSFFLFGLLQPYWTIAVNLNFASFLHLQFCCWTSNPCSLNFLDYHSWYGWPSFKFPCHTPAEKTMAKDMILWSIKKVFPKDHQTGFPNVHPSCPLPTFQPFPAPQGRHGRFWSFLGAGDAVESDDAPGGPGRRRQRMVFGELGLPHCLLVSNTLW